jgi:ABC-2 type transport system permease protein
MTGMKAISLVAGRELHQAVRRKSFWLVAALLLVGSSVAMTLSQRGPKQVTYHVGMVGTSSSIESSIREAARMPLVTVNIESLPDRQAARTAVEKGDTDVAIVVGQNPVIVTQADGDERILGIVERALVADSVSGRLQANGASQADVQEALASLHPRIERLDPAGSSRRGAAAILATVLYLLLIILMMQVANGTAIEKSNRISEVLLAIVRPGALLFGKVIGVGLVGVLTLLCGIVPVAVRLSSGGKLPEGMGSALIGGSAWFVLGIAFYLTLAGALGALVERQEEAGSVVTPLTMTLVAGFFVAQSAPASPLADVLAYVPFTSPLVMPSRIAVGVASPLEMAGSLLVGVVSLAIVVRLGATVYQRAIVRTGKRLRIGEVLAQKA